MNGAIGGVGPRMFQIHSWFWRLRFRQEQSQTARHPDQDGRVFVAVGTGSALGSV
jgi:hypothetical protein